MRTANNGRAAVFWMILLALGTLAQSTVRAQNAGDLGKIVEKLTETPATDKTTADSKKDATAKASDAEVTPSTTPIDVNNTVDEAKVAKFLNETLASFPGVQHVEAEVKGSVVTLNGRVKDDAVAERLREVALKVDGVVFAINRLRTDAQSLSAFELLGQQLNTYWRAIEQRWLLFLFALALILGGLAVARLINKYSDTFLAPIVANPLLRSVIGSLIALAAVVAGTTLALQVLGIADVVLSVLGLAGVAALAIGFAFRDIAENFIASILLGFRRPFRVGDFIKVSGQAGVVRSLNTRATVLMTLEGHLVRIPNAIMFKEILVNTTAAPQVRSTFDVLIPHEASIAEAQSALNQALCKHDGLARDPAPRALVEEIAREGIRLRVYYWVPTKGVDGFRLNSDARLLAKVALQQANIGVPADVRTIQFSPDDELAVRMTGAVSSKDWPPGSSDATATERAKSREQDTRGDLLRDSRAAVLAAADTASDDDAVRRVLDLANDSATQEGANLLNRRRKNGATDKRDTAARNAQSSNSG